MEDQRATQKRGAPKGPPPPLEEALRLARATKAFGLRRDGEGRLLVNYLYASPEVFALEGARELRGLVYREEDGTVLSRPFHKFFNYGEPPHGLGERDLRGRRVYLAPKVDGYLLQVWWEEEGGLRWASRHSLEPPLVGALARELWTEAHGQAARELLEGGGLTLLFEVVDPRAPVLVAPEAPGLFLLAARRVATGEYLLPGVDFSWPLEAVPWRKVVSFDPEALRESLREAEGLEGYVAFLPEEGELVKFKSRWAFALAEFLKRPEENFLRAYAQERLDDLLGALAGRKDLARAVARAREVLEALYAQAVETGEELRARGLLRREAWERAVVKAEAQKGFASAFLRAAMAAYEGREAREAFLRELGKGKALEALEALRLFPRVGKELLS